MNAESNTKKKRKGQMKDGLSVAIIYFLLSIIVDWRKFRTTELAINNLGIYILGSLFVGLVFGLLFRPTFDFISRQYAHKKHTKIPPVP